MPAALFKQQLLSSLICIMLFVAITSCHTESEESKTEKLDKMVEKVPDHSMKGWELYTWQDSIRHYTLLEGTNRIKTDEEIKTSRQYITTDALLERIDQLQQGEQIVLKNLNGPEDSLDNVSLQLIKAIAEKKQLQLVIQ